MTDVRPIHIALTTMCLLAGILLPASAFAQDEPRQNSLSVNVTVVGLTGTTTSSFVGTFAVNSRTRKLNKEKDELESLVLIDSYLSDHEHEVRFAVTMGGGDPINELAMFMGRVEPLDALERAALRARRQDLTDALGMQDETPDSLTRARAVYAILLPIVHPDTAQLEEAAE